MADNEEIKGFRKWVADRLKLNPAQPLTLNKPTER